MKLLNLDGREVRVQIDPTRYPIRSREQCRSQGQFHLGQMLQSIYPGGLILEEFSIPGTRLAIDFYMPHRKMAFEFQGVQHDERNTFFHRSESDFKQQQRRDTQKRNWCELNEITLIEVRDKTITPNALRQLIVDA